MRKLVRFSYPFSKQLKWVDYLLSSVKVCFVVLFVIVASKSFSQTAPVEPPKGGFKIDGYLRANTPAGSNAGDWVPRLNSQDFTGGVDSFVLNNAGAPKDLVTTKLKRDPYNSSSDSIFAQGSKFNDHISALHWTTGTAPDKNDIHNGIFHASGGGSDQWIFIGGDRLAVNGTSYIDFEFLQGSITINSNGTFTGSGPNGGRTVANGGDINISMEYNNGGTAPKVVIYRWKLLSGTTYYWDSTGSSAITDAYAKTNLVTVDVPFGAFGNTTYQPFAFVEAAINITQLLSLGSGTNCGGLSIKTLWIKTKAASTSTAALKDFMSPISLDLNFGGVNIDQKGPACVDGSNITLTATPTGGSFSGPGVTVGTSTFVPSDAGVGTHQIIYTASVGSNCTKKDTMYIVVNPKPTVSVNSPTKCANDPAITLTATPGSGAGGDYNYAWTVPATATAPGNVQTFSATVAGTYSVIITNKTTSCTSISGSGTLTVNANPTVTVNSPTKCANDPAVTITATPGSGSVSDYNYAWSVPATATAPGNVQSFSATVAGTYSVIITNKTTNCASASGSGTLTVNANPTITGPAVGAICAGTTSAALSYSSVPSGTDQYRIVWTSGPTTMNSFVSLPTSPISIPNTGSLSASTYNGTIYVKNSITGCISAGDAVSLVVNANPTITSPAVGAICLGTSSASLSYSGVSSGVDQYRIVWTSGPATMNSFVSLPTSPITIPNTGSLTAGTYNGTIYVKNSTTGCISAGDAVSLLINSLPDAPTLSVTQPTCGNSNGTVTVTAPLDAGAIDYEYTKDDGAHWQDGVSFTIAADAGYSIKVRRKSTGCISAATSGTMGHATSTPAAAAIITQNVSCSSSTGKVKIVMASNQQEYDNIIFEFSSDGVNFGSNPEFTFTAGQGYNLTVRRKTDHSCTASTSCAAEGGGITRISSSTSEATIESQTTVKAYPNPFSDRIKFVVTSPVAGKGNLEVYNMMGQRVKTVYQGFISAGTQTFELSLPTQQIANLVYVLRIGDKKMSGKILQINQ
jgi:NO-binding membrane sensor protein with MHYT domain